MQPDRASLALHRAGPRRSVLVGALLAACVVVLVTCCAGASGARAASSVQATTASAARTITVYSAPTSQAFIDNNDDEARGDVNNPAGTRDAKAAAIEEEHSNGPYPGDETLFGFNIFKDAHLGSKTGSAVITCQYYFGKNGFCDASFQLAGGTLIGAGAFNFDAQSFALAITGGDGAYAQASGDVEVTPSGKKAQRLVFTLVRG